MSMSLNGNGHGNGTSTTARPAPKKAAPPAPPAPVGGEGQVAFRTDGAELRGTPVRMTRLAAVFELYNPSVTPRISESLDEFQIYFQKRTIYSGRAVVCKIFDAGPKIICEATLDESHWTDVNIESLAGHGQIAGEFQKFILEWQKLYKISPEFKIVIVDMHTFFSDMRFLLDRLELKDQAEVPNGKSVGETEMARELATVILPVMDKFFARFENAAHRIDDDQKVVYANYMRRMLHPLILSAPFANRTYLKPRGYAGDYEMVNMILRNGFEGASLFAKIIHHWFVRQPPAEAHRNRIKYLIKKLEEEACRLLRANRPLRVFNFACGPAVEVQSYLRNSPIAGNIDITLVDFDEETLNHVRDLLTSTIRERQLRAVVNFEKKSVHNLIKDRFKLAERKKYDLVYCAGLFDYLPDNACRQLMDIFYGMVAPGGLLVATNVEPENPLRYGMENLLDWHLIYRAEKDMRSIAPILARKEDMRIWTETTGVNLFLEIRNPNNA